MEDLNLEKEDLVEEVNTSEVEVVQTVQADEPATQVKEEECVEQVQDGKKKKKTEKKNKKEKVKKEKSKKGKGKKESAKTIILKSYMESKLVKFKNREALEKNQNKMYQKHMQTMARTSNFYNHILTLKNVEIPVIDKNMLMSNFDKMNTLGLTKAACLDLKDLINNIDKVDLTDEQKKTLVEVMQEFSLQETTDLDGNPAVFLQTAHDRNVLAGKILAKVLPSGLLVPERVMYFTDLNNNVLETVKIKSVKLKFMDYNELSDTVLEEVQKFKPTVIIAPPSVLKLLAEKQKDNDIKIAPKSLFSTSSILGKRYRKEIQDVFNIVVYQLYLTNEAFIGSTCEYGTIHLNEEFVIVEKEYLQGSKTMYNPIITNLIQTGQPIIRYKMDDILIDRKKPCPCGRCTTGLRRIEGRNDSLIYALSQDGIKRVEIYPYIMQNLIFKTSDAIEAFQILQKDYSSINIRLKYKGTVSSKNREQIQNSIVIKFAQLLGELKCHELDVCFLEEIPDTQFVPMFEIFNMIV